MRSTSLRVALLSLLVFVNLANSKCPVRDPDSFSSPEEFIQHLEDLDDFCHEFEAFLDGLDASPNSVLVPFPFGFGFNKFGGEETLPVNAKVGSSTVPSDQSVVDGAGPLGVPADRIEAPIRLTTQFPLGKRAVEAPAGSVNLGDAVYVDLDDDGTFDTDEELFIQRDGESFLIENPLGGMIPAAGRYAATFLGDVFDFDNSLDVFAFPFRLQLFYDDPEGGAAMLEGTLLHLENASVLPHVPFGVFSIPAGSQGVIERALTTQIVINNPYPIPVTGRLLFRDTMSGEEVDVPISRVENIEALGAAGLRPAGSPPGFEFTLSGYEGVTFELDFLQAVSTVWAFVVGTEPLSAAANFVTFDLSGTAGQAERPNGSNTVAEAGIASSNLANAQVLNVGSSSDGIGTAIAIVNPTADVAHIHLKLKARPVGEQVQGTGGDPILVADAMLEMEPFTQTARFYNELFDLPPGDFQGWLEIRSDTSLAITSLKTINLLQSSSLPAGN